MYLKAYLGLIYTTLELQKNYNSYENDITN